MKHYRTAFRSLLNSLILRKPIDWGFLGKTSTEISAMVQKEYLYGYLNEQANAHEYVDTLISSLKIVDDSAEEVVPLRDAVDHEKVETEMYSAGDDADGNPISISDETFLTVTAAELRVRPSYYLTTGFTPKLSSFSTVSEMGFQQTNCFGQTIVFGALCKKRGLHVELGISPDHPYVVITLEDGTYIFDERRSVSKMEGILTQHEEYKTYMPLPAENIEPCMIIIVPFDEGILYEILENMEVFHHAFLGLKNNFLPGSQTEVVHASMKHRAVIKMANWKAVQRYFFPSIAKAFDEQREDFEREIQSVAKRRYEYDRDHGFDTCIFECYTKKELDQFKTAQKAIEDFISKAQPYTDLALLFLWRGNHFLDNVPENIIILFSTLKREIQKQAEEQDFGFQEFAYKRIHRLLTLNTETNTKRKEQVCSMD